MELKELKKIQEFSTEEDLLKTLEEINDKVIFRYYNEEQILYLVESLIRIDLLSLQYETREELLYVLCDVVTYYKIHDKVNWENIISIKGELETDLKEYVAEIEKFH